VSTEIIADLDGTSPRWVRGIYVANLVAQMGIVVTGAVVRLTSSGLGCPKWPQCTGESITPVAGQVEEWHKYVEFGNRALTGVLIVLAFGALAAAVWDARRRRAAALPSRRSLTWLAAVPLLGTVAQIPLGGLTVLTGLNPIAVGSHLLLSLVLIALAAALVRRAGESGDGPLTSLVRREVRIGIIALTCVIAVVLVVGILVTASGPHAGDSRTRRLGLDPQMISWLHADLVVLAIGLLIGLRVALTVTQAHPRSRRAATVALVVFLAQGLIGYVQYFTGLPWVVVGVHVLGATVVWLVTIRLVLSIGTRSGEISSAV